MNQEKDARILSVEMTEFLDEMVPKELCTIDRYGDADDFDGCGNCFSMANAENMDEDCQGCIVNKIFQEYAKEQARQNQLKAEQEQRGQIFRTAVQTWGKKKTNGHDDRGNGRTDEGDFKRTPGTR